MPIRHNHAKGSISPHIIMDSSFAQITQGSIQLEMFARDSPMSDVLIRENA